MSMYGVSQGTQDRERKLIDLKRRIAKRYGSIFVDIASLQTPFQTIRKSDTEEIKLKKKEENEIIIKKREEEYSNKEVEITCELEKIMERVKATRPDTAGLQELYSLTSNAALLMQRFHCDQCGNEVRCFEWFML